jgi:hypothetical protein
VKVVISGSSGLIGSALVKDLLAGGHAVTRLVRPGGPVGAGTIAWNPDTGVLDGAALENFDAVVHLSGKNLATDKWTEENKKQLVESRTRSTRLLCGRLKQLQNPPRTFISASATGYYGSRGDEELTERSTVGSGFLAELTYDWEKAAEPLDESGIRVVHLRLGVVLSSQGGALPRMVKPFKLGLGGTIGSGRQYISWIGLDDVIGVIKFILDNENIGGPVNAVAPRAVTNREFTESLASALNRPAAAKIPAFALRLMYGEMADETLLSSTRVVPKVLVDAGYDFIDPELTPALKKYIE